MGDLGGYGIAELPPTGPLFARGPYRALGQKGNPWEVVRNSISAHVTHAEITHCLMELGKKEKEIILVLPILIELFSLFLDTVQCIDAKIVSWAL